MASGDHYLITLRAHHSVSGTSIQNAFVYTQASGTAGAIALNIAFNVGIVIEGIVPICHSSYIVDDLYTINLDDPDDFDVLTDLDPGEVGGAFLPIYNTWEFEFTRTSRSVNNGRKAIGIISEDSQNNGVPIAEMTAPLEALAALMAGSVVSGDLASTWLPSIWRRPGTYVSGVVAAPGQFYDVADVVFRRISTQNTRKIGRGS